jgi:hypothetical protein
VNIGRFPAYEELKRHTAREVSPRLRELVFVSWLGTTAAGSPARMSVLADVKSRVTGLKRVARSEKERYSGGEERPLGGYLAAMSVYVAAVGTLAGVTRLIGRDVPDGLAAGDLLLAAVATHKLSRLITRDPVTSPLRAPFTTYQGQEGPAELDEEVRGQGAEGDRGAHHLPVLPGPVGGDGPDDRLYLPSAGDQARCGYPGRAGRR